MRRRARVVALTATLTIMIASTAIAAVYRGAGRDDPEMPVRLTVSGREVTFSYSDVLVSCSDGSEVRQGGAVHAARLSAEGRFKDTLDVEGAPASTIDVTTSVVRGRLSGKRAWGTVAYDLVYEGGACHSDAVKWSAKRR